MNEEHSIGETDFECWGRLWKNSLNDPEVVGGRVGTFLEQIEAHFRSKYENFPDPFTSK
jgi:hypothetical protein